MSCWEKPGEGWNFVDEHILYAHVTLVDTDELHTCQVTLDISGSHTESQWGYQKYPG